MSTQVPRLLAGLVDDAAVFPPGSASLHDALAAHRRHRASWYAHLVGPLLVPASALPAFARLLDADEPGAGDRLEIGAIGDVPIGRLVEVCDELDPRLRVRQVEAAAARRGQDPLPGVAELAALARPGEPLYGESVDVYAEIPIDRGLPEALDRLADARAGGARIAAKFRTGGLSADLFPSPVELAGVIAACRDRDLPFKLTAGLHHAARHVDPKTGFTHHGFVNVLAAVLAAADGASVEEVTELLAAADSRLLLGQIDPERARPLWVGFGSCSVLEPMADLIQLGLVDGSVDA